MSLESENQNIPTIAAVSLQENPALTCVTCSASIGANDTKLKCENSNCGASTCSTCLNLMLEVMLGEPMLNYPLTCGSCGNSFAETTTDQVFAKHATYDKFIACMLPLFWKENCLEKDEKLAQCPFCPYIEIHTTDACPLHFLTCQHPSCGTRSCLICLHAITDDNDELIHRNRCVEFHPYKRMVEDAIESGSQQRCPHCQLSGLKDDGCTHMVCARCGLTWCYLCGMKEDECLVETDADQSLSAHNDEWENHQGRCPMSLTSIHELDARWPNDDRDCLEYFHRYRTVCELYNVLKIVGEEKLDQLNDTFGIIDASGYTIDEIKDYHDRVLIRYPSAD